MEHALAVAVEPFKFSPRQVGVAYELREFESRGEKSELYFFIANHKIYHGFFFKHLSIFRLL
jgi:hypothetical protein